MATVGSVLGFHTLNARDNGLIHWIFSDYSKSDPHQFRQAMQTEGARVRDLLSSRGVRYDELKSALVPSDGGQQAVFFYDWREDPSWNYAVAFAKEYLPRLRRTVRTSMLHGDLLDFGGRMPIEDLQHRVVKPRMGSINWQTQYAVYFSNLRPSDVAALHEELSAIPRYSGYIDVSLASPTRDFLARTMVSEWVIFDRKIVLSHGADEPWVGNEDPVGFDLPSHGFEVVSLMDSYFIAFLSYKIEADAAQRADDDRILNLAAVTGELLDVETVDIAVPPSKLDRYLLFKEDKLRLMTSIGLQDVTPEELSGIIRTKLSRNYVYDFRFAPDGTPGFAVVAEFEKPTGGLTRRLLALKYDLEAKAISLVSVY